MTETHQSRDIAVPGRFIVGTRGPGKFVRGHIVSERPITPPRKHNLIEICNQYAEHQSRKKIIFIIFEINIDSAHRRCRELKLKLYRLFKFILFKTNIYWCRQPQARGFLVQRGCQDYRGWQNLHQVVHSSTPGVRKKGENIHQHKINNKKSDTHMSSLIMFFHLFFKLNIVSLFASSSDACSASYIENTSFSFKECNQTGNIIFFNYSHLVKKLFLKCNFHTDW